MEPMTRNLYIYGNANPLTYVDPSGHVIETPWDLINVGLDISSIGYDIYSGDWAGLAIDTAGLVYDGVATAVPGLPGGAGALRAPARVKKVLTIADKARDAIKIGEKLNGPMKDALRAQARNIMKNNKSFKAAIEAGKKLDVHHIIPLEYVHLMGKNFDPNKFDNLAGVDHTLHKKLNARWKDFRDYYTNKIKRLPTEVEIRNFAELLTREFGENFVR
jgi:hypothetical protein